MLINEVCKKCMLTKKAIEYYEEQRLVKPAILENGYRDFTLGDVEQLKKISILRKLGLSIPDIEAFLNDGKSAICNISRKKMMDIEVRKTQIELTQILAQEGDWEYVRSRLNALAQKQSILERLLDVFPGYYGRYVSMHFGSYLNEPITTIEQQEAFETIIKFLDHADCVIPADLQEYLEEATENFDESFMINMSDNLKKCVENPKQYMSDNQMILEQYMAFKQSEEYRQSPAYKLKELFTEFNRRSGYDDIFIPAMKVLSKSYHEYHVALEEANKVFLEKYPDQASN